jgi:hypothetical protein
MNFYQDAGLINAKLSNIENLILKWGEASGPFLSIEPLMRYIAELDKPLREKVSDLIKNDKSTKNNQYIHYSDCNPKYLVDAIKSIFGMQIPPETLIQICKYPLLRDKFLHGNFIALMEIMKVEPSSRMYESSGKRKRLEPGEIYESFLSMDREDVFGKLRTYSADVRIGLKGIIQGFAIH